MMHAMLLSLSLLTSQPATTDDALDAIVPKVCTCNHPSISVVRMSRPNPSADGNTAAKGAAASASAGPPRAAPLSSQMQAVMRVLTGQEERTLAQKLADPNRPTWEQYKKDNEDKLNLEGVDQKKMEEYRQQLDAERDKFLARGTNYKGSGEKKKKSKKRKRRHHHKDRDSGDSSESDSDDSSDDDKRRKKHKKRKKKHKKRDRHRDVGSNSDDGGKGGDHASSADGSDDSGDRKRKPKSSKQHKKKKKRADSGDESEGSHYRLSKFFEGSDASE